MQITEDEIKLFAAGLDALARNIGQRIAQEGGRTLSKLLPKLVELDAGFTKLDQELATRAAARGQP